MRKILIEITGGFDLLERSATIAGICMNIFKLMFLPPKHIPLVPEGGFERNENASTISIKYFNWIAKKENVEIQHAENGGEMKFGKYKVDAYIAKENRAIEFLGLLILYLLKKIKFLDVIFTDV